jgi:hypothetical protein
MHKKLRSPISRGVGEGSMGVHCVGRLWRTSKNFGERANLCQRAWRLRGNPPSSSTHPSQRRPSGLESLSPIQKEE